MKATIQNKVEQTAIFCLFAKMGFTVRANIESNSVYVENPKSPVTTKQEISQLLDKDHQLRLKGKGIVIV